MEDLKMNKEDLKELRELLAITWNNNEKMIRHCLKSSKYVKVGDKFIDVCDSKPNITKTLYYDDEYEAPEVNFETFLLYNKKNMPTEWKLEGRTWGDSGKLLIIPQYSGDKTNFRLCGLTYNEKDSDKSMEVTPEMLEKINEAVREVQEDYKKRLAAYWKRYNKNIHAYGYWANR
jgi:hypothetical protein